MEYPKHPGGTEECSSNESGWTMYIGSPYRDYDNDDDDDNDEDEEEGIPRKGYKNVDDHIEDGGSDDSMTSDASSGPSHQGVRTNIERKHVEKDNRKFSSKEQQKLAKKKSSEKNIKAAKEDSGHKAKSGKGYGYCRSTRGKH